MWFWNVLEKCSCELGMIWLTAKPKPSYVFIRILLQTSPRVAWNVTYKLAVAWETDVLFAVSRIASFFESWDV